MVSVREVVWGGHGKVYKGEGEGMGRDAHHGVGAIRGLWAGEHLAGRVDGVKSGGG